MNDCIEIEIGAGAQAGCYEVRVVRSAGGGEPSGRLVVDAAEILARHRELQTAVLASSVSARSMVTSVEQPVREVGQRLFEALFSGPVYGAYRASLGAVQQGGGRLRVVLRLTAPELAALPWEALFDPETQTYLCRKEPLVRHVPAPYTQPPLEIRPPLRILGLVASPRGMPVLDVEMEQQNLETALAQPIADGLVELVWMHQPSWEAIHSKLLGGEWHVLHFIGHGDYDADADEGVLYLVGADGRAKAVEASRLTDLLGEARPPLRLVVLNSCSSAQAGSQDLFSGTAAVLAHNGIDVVAAMQYSITDTAAIAFARGFYTALAHGLAVEEAACSGRVEIVGIGHTLEWVTPVLYVRGDITRPFIITGKTPIAEPSRLATEAADSHAKPRRLPGLISGRRARQPQLRRPASSSDRDRLRGRKKVWKVWAPVAAAVVAAGLIMALMILDPWSSRHTPSPSPHRPANAVSVYSGRSYHFSNPLAIAVDGTHVWVANYSGNSVTELNASDGKWELTLSGGSYGFNEPGKIAVDGAYLWVPNSGGDSVTELNASDGSWVRTLSGGSYGFDRPWAIAVDGSHLWVANQGGSVTELNASDGSWVRTLSGGSYGFDGPWAIAADGTHLWVANNTNSSGDSVTELNASDGSWVRTLSGGSYGFNGPYAIAVDGTHVWVANPGGDSVTELNASDGSWVRTLSGGSLGFKGPIGIAVDGTHVWVVANGGGDSVTKLPAG